MQLRMEASSPRTRIRLPNPQRWCDTVVDDDADGSEHAQPAADANTHRTWEPVQLRAPFSVNQLK